MESRERSVRYYQTKSGVIPFRDWRSGFFDKRTRAAIDVRVTRIRSGNLSDSRPVGAGVLESRIDFGPGYRIYYGAHGDLIILLCGGDKASQDADIKLARDYWKDDKKRVEL